jgi:hypothetical protein
LPTAMLAILPTAVLAIVLPTAVLAAVLVHFCFFLRSALLSLEAARSLGGRLVR